MRVGIPRLLNMFLYTPFFSTYLRSLGVGKVVYSEYTSTRLWEEGNKWGSIDPCFPAKVAPAHIYNLLTKIKPTQILFPIQYVRNVILLHQILKTGRERKVFFLRMGFNAKPVMDPAVDILSQKLCQIGE